MYKQRKVVLNLDGDAPIHTECHKNADTIGTAKYYN